MITRDELMDLLAVDSKRFLFDNFQSHDEILDGSSGSGSVTYNINAVTVASNLIANSEAWAYYSTQLFNPLYSRLLMRLRLNGMADLLAFWGFRQLATAPSWHMTESHAGFMLYQGSLYAVTGDAGTPSANYKTNLIADIDCTRDLVYEIKGDKFRWYSVPFLESSFEGLVAPAFEKLGFRKWSPVYSNASIQPHNQVHYIYFYLKNLTNEQKYMELKNICYQEDYSD
jgi:hypothetical protein